MEIYSVANQRSPRPKPHSLGMRPVFSQARAIFSITTNRTFNFFYGLRRKTPPPRKKTGILFCDKFSENSAARVLL